LELSPPIPITEAGAATEKSNKLFLEISISKNLKTYNLQNHPMQMDHHQMFVQYCDLYVYLYLMKKDE
jgi:hypothetical protein